MAATDVLIVGGGLAGLCCARHLLARDIPCRVLEAGDAVGGRVRTDEVDGFRLDRGFQVFLTAYPEAREVLDYDALDLRSFYSGAEVFYEGGFHRVADPLREPLAGLRTAVSSVGTFADKLRVLKLRRAVAKGTPDDLWARPDATTERALGTRYGFSDRMIERFFRPFIGGIALDRDLRQSNRFFEFTFRMFADGEAAVPAQGMQAIPEQLQAALPDHTVRLNARVTRIAPGEVELEAGERIPARAVVLATDAPEASYLVDGLDAPEGLASTTLYFAADRPPLGKPVLMLNGTGSGLVNTVVELSTVAQGYAPEGQALISVAIVGSPVQADDAVETAVREELRAWFGDAVDGWRHLHTYRVLHALPDQTPPALQPPERPHRLRPGLYVAGDHRVNASINGAMRSGRLAAEAVAEDLA